VEVGTTIATGQSDMSGGSTADLSKKQSLTKLTRWNACTSSRHHRCHSPSVMISSPTAEMVKLDLSDNYVFNLTTGAIGDAFASDATRFTLLSRQIVDLGNSWKAYRFGLRCWPPSPI
jgi:hypothetical protein